MKSTGVLFRERKDILRQQYQFLRSKKFFNIVFSTIGKYIYIYTELKVDHTDAFSSNGAKQTYDHSRREKVWLHAELEDRERALQETRIRTLQEMED